MSTPYCKFCVLWYTYKMSTVVFTLAHLHEEVSDDVARPEHPAA